MRLYITKTRKHEGDSMAGLLCVRRFATPIESLTTAVDL
jgi:hypothetical protein